MDQSFQSSVRELNLTVGEFYILLDSVIEDVLKIRLDDNEKSLKKLHGKWLVVSLEERVKGHYLFKQKFVRTHTKDVHPKGPVYKDGKRIGHLPFRISNWKFKDSN
jgi:hypothetical protein